MDFVFFDLDDTLLDHGHASMRGAEGFHREYSGILGIPWDEFIRAWKEAGRVHMERYLLNEITYADQRRARVRQVFAPAGITLSDSEADGHFAVYLRHYEAAWRLFEDVMPCVEALEGHRLGVISNGDGAQQRKKLRRTGLEDRLECSVFSGELGIAKPEAGIFLEAARRVGAEPARCVYIGDRPETDAAAAVNAGMNGVWLNRGGAEARGVDVPVIPSLCELPALLAR